MENEKFNIKPSDAKILHGMVTNLQSLYAVVGMRFVELTKNTNQCQELQRSIEQLQEDIAKEFNIPRNARMNWNIADCDNAYIETINEQSPEELVDSEDSVE